MFFSLWHPSFDLLKKLFRSLWELDKAVESKLVPILCDEYAYRTPNPKHTP